MVDTSYLFSKYMNIALYKDVVEDAVEVPNDVEGLYLDCALAIKGLHMGRFDDWFFEYKSVFIHGDYGWGTRNVFVPEKVEVAKKGVRRFWRKEAKRLGLTEEESEFFRNIFHSTENRTDFALADSEKRKKVMIDIYDKMGFWKRLGYSGEIKESYKMEKKARKAAS